MQRRLLTTLLIVVMAGLLVTGLGTFLIARSNAGAHAQELALERAQGVAAVTTWPASRMPEPRRTALQDVLAKGGKLTEGKTNTKSMETDELALRPEQLRSISQSLGVRQIGVLIIQFESKTQVTGKVVSQLPEGVELDDIDLFRLLEQGYIGGRKDNIAYGAAISRFWDDPNAGAVFVVSVETTTKLGPAAGWFLIAAAATLLLAIGASIWLSRSLSRPLSEAAKAARRIASGDLSVRLPPFRKKNPDELSDLAQAINEMAAGLEHSRGLERRFLLSVSHDLRTPLTSISGYAEALSDGTTEDAATAGRVIGLEAERLTRLVRDLLDLARLDTHRFDLDLCKIDLRDPTRQTTEALSTIVGEIELSTDMPEKPVEVFADADRWAQIVNNLVENGLRYAENSLQISIHIHNNQAILQVVDDGPGIFEADLPHIFERLYVSRSTSAGRETGSGLGLAIVRELAQAMNGQVKAESPPEGGARLLVSLPLA